MWFLSLLVFLVCLAILDTVVHREWYKINHFVIFPHFKQYYNFLKARKDIKVHTGKSIVSAEWRSYINNTYAVAMKDHAEWLNRMLFPQGREFAVMELERKIEEAGWGFERKCDGHCRTKTPKPHDLDPAAFGIDGEDSRTERDMLGEKKNLLDT